MHSDEELFAMAFPSLARPEARTGAPPELLRLLSCRRFERAEILIREGEACSSIPFVLEGSIRVFKTADSGRELTLYRIEKGESCVLSSGCSAGIARFPGTAVAERETRAALLPSRELPRLLEANADFRDFVLGQYARKLSMLFELSEELAFRRVDERLAELLARRGHRSDQDSSRRDGHESGRRGHGAGDSEKSAARTPVLVEATHQELADHLGSSREVVSRILKDWEERGLVRLSRGRIELDTDLPRNLGFEPTSR